MKAWWGGGREIEGKVLMLFSGKSTVLKTGKQNRSHLSVIFRDIKKISQKSFKYLGRGRVWEKSRKMAVFHKFCRTTTVNKLCASIFDLNGCFFLFFFFTTSSSRVLLSQEVFSPLLYPCGYPCDLKGQRACKGNVPTPCQISPFTMCPWD